MTPLSDAEKASIRQLLRKADADLSLAELLVDQAVYFDNLTFHAQQAAEKYLKTRLMLVGEVPAKTHDLIRLLNELAQFEPISADDRRLGEFLTPYAVKMRYLTDEGTEPPVADFIAAARHFRDRLRPAIEAALR